MTIPAAKQSEFEKWFKETAGPVLGKFGAKRHEIYKTVKENRFVERIYFDNDFDIPDYFVAVKADSNAWEISRMYEGKFGAKDVELKVLGEI
mgnify:FL=1